MAPTGLMARMAPMARVAPTARTTSPRPPRAPPGQTGRARSNSSSSADARGTVADEHARLGHDRDRALALRDLPAGPLLGRDRGRVPVRDLRRRARGAH